MSGGAAMTTPRRRSGGVTARSVGAAASAASIWETRIKMDEVKGGIKVFNVGENNNGDDEEGLRVLRKLRRNQSGSNGVAAATAEGKKRKSWKSAAAVSPAQLRKSQSEISSGQRIVVEDVKKVEEVEVEVEKQIDQEIDGEKEKTKTKSVDGLEKEESSKEGNVSAIAEDMDEEEEEEEMEVEDDTLILEEKSVDVQDMKQEQVIPVQEKVVETRKVNLEAVKSPQEKKTGPVINNDLTNLEVTKPSPGKRPAAANNDHSVNPEPSPKAPLEKKLPSLSESRSISPEPFKLTPTKSTDKKVTFVINHRSAFQSEPRKPVHVEVPYEEVHHHATYRNYNRMQNMVDLVMWRDVSKSAFVFGLGTFMLVSSSYAKDLKFNLISAVSYMGLTYLGLIFTYRTILQRGVIDLDEGQDHGFILVGEEEAIWLLRLVLPYINDALLKLKGLFSGDPATTMKLALLLFAMARCGSFLNLWTLAKLGFFGVFTIPKICSAYSTHLARYERERQRGARFGGPHFGGCVFLSLPGNRTAGKFWVERFRDGWEACTHKKAVAAALFTLFWNISSTTARVWAVFMLVVAFKYYQQRMAEEWKEQEEEVEEVDDIDEVQEEIPKKKVINNNQAQVNSNGFHHRQRNNGPVTFEVNRERKTKRTL